MSGDTCAYDRSGAKSALDVSGAESIDSCVA